MKKRMKRLASLLLAGAMALNLAACGSGNDAEEKGSNESNESNESKEDAKHLVDGIAMDGIKG